MRILRNALAASLLSTAHLVLAQPACTPTPMTAGPVGTVNVNGVTQPSGFSDAVTDTNGVRLVQCLTGNGNPDGTPGNPCFFSPAESGNTLSEALGRGMEAFWFLADNRILTSGAAAIEARVVMGVESTFTSPAVQDGFQTQFQRLRIRANVNATGHYTFEHPWGSKTYQVTTLLSGDGLSKGEINDTLDVPFAAGQAAAGLVTPFLRWDPGVAPAAPAGYLGDGFTPHAVLGSPCGSNFVRVTAVALDGTTPIAIDPTDADTDGKTNSYTSGLFTVMGRRASTPTLVASPKSLDFGGQSMATTSPARSITLTNGGLGTLSFANLALDNAQFAMTHDCTSLVPGASCTAIARFSPAVAPGALLATVPVNATLTVTSNGASSPDAFAVTGTAEKSLVSHYYRSILRRGPDAGGKAFWDSEAMRMQSLGANVNETWYSMSSNFYTSAEYAAVGRDDNAYVVDLYNTFFNRLPDAGGLSFWVGELSAGMPREVLLASFMFSPEFTTFTQGIFGTTAVRKEIDTVMDFYRGLLARLPDSSGFDFWVREFRAAQCQSASAVTAKADAISRAFTVSPEYLARARSDSQYVGDLYNAFLRRGGELAGVRFWIGQIATGARTREEVRQAFVASPEFGSRVSAIIGEGCLSTARPTPAATHF